MNEIFFRLKDIDKDFNIENIIRLIKEYFELKNINNYIE